jgi:hypothetical protein
VESFLNYTGYFISLVQTDNSIDALGLFEQLCLQSFAEAACYNNFFYSSGGFAVHGMFYGLEGFVFGGGDEAAGIDNNDIGIVRLGGYHKVGLSDFGQHFFAVDYIFGTTQCYKAHGYGFFGGFSCHSPLKVAEKLSSV